MRRHELLKLPLNEALLELLLALLLASHALAVCPSVCSCSRRHREVDCSWRGLRQLPDGLQHDLRSLNLSHNRLHDLDGRLTPYTHLRILDLSHNRLTRLPAGLPRSLWQLRAASNRVRLLDKNDTVHQWNLRALDLSNNKLERAIFINNTLINLCSLNLSYNHFWTLPTNLPVHLEAIDLSHNFLVKALPGSLDRLPRLTHFYLHTNRFSTLPSGLFDKMTSLRLVTLGDNPWACHHFADVSYLLSWTQQTSARVLGCPCHTQPICGRTGGWHFASYNLPPLAASAQEMSPVSAEASVTGWWYMTVSALLTTTKETSSARYHPFTVAPVTDWWSSMPLRTTGAPLAISHLSSSDHTPYTDSYFTTGPEEASPDAFSISDPSLITKTPIGADVTFATDRFITTESSTVLTKKTTTLRTRSVRRQNQSPPSGVRSGVPALTACRSLPLLGNLWLLPFILQHVF